MVLKTFFDGGNKTDSRCYKIASLAAVSGTAEVWKPFGREWNKNLRKHGADYLHTTDVLSGAKPFDSWSLKQRHAFMEDCSRIARKHAARKARSLDDLGMYGLFPFTVSVVLKDFVEARRSNENIPDTADEMLIRQAVYHTLEFTRTRMPAKFFHFVFDQNEPFRGYVCSMMTSKRARKEALILDRIVQNAEANMRFYPELQLADLYAWSVAHSRENLGYSWLEKLLKHDRDDFWADASNIQDVMPSSLGWKQWKIPKRKATR